MKMLFLLSELFHSVQLVIWTFFAVQLSSELLNSASIYDDVAYEDGLVLISCSFSPIWSITDD